MSGLPFSQKQLLNQAKFGSADLELINSRRRDSNRLGFAYQLAFVRLTNHFPNQHAIEVEPNILAYVGFQLKLPVSLIKAYQIRRETIAEHQTQIMSYLGLRRFGEVEAKLLGQFIFAEALRLEQVGPLLTKSQQFLQENNILQPAKDTLQRLIGTQRLSARTYIFERLAKLVSADQQKQLDALLQVDDSRISPLQLLKQPPRTSSATAMQQLVNKLEQIKTMGVLELDLSWLNNNYQRSLTRYVQRCSANRLRRLNDHQRYAMLVCFLHQTYQNTVDYLVDMHDKLITKLYNRAQTEINEETKRRRAMLRQSLRMLQTLGQIVLDKNVEDQALRKTVFQQISETDLATQLAEVEAWLNGKYSHVFNLVIQRFNYIRQFSPLFLEHLAFELEDGASSTLVEGIELLRQMNQENKRKLPDDAPQGFVPKKLRPFVQNEDGTLNKHAWECALLTAIRDEIKAGNLFVGQSKRFGQFNDFFILNTTWKSKRTAFFKRANLPEQAKDVPAYLTERLNQAFDTFLAELPNNSYAHINDEGWQLSVDPADKLDQTDQQKLERLKQWLTNNLRTIKLPELLIEVDNAIGFTQHFSLAQQTKSHSADDVCAILAAIIAHGCNIGPYTMAQLTQNVTYDQIKTITDWQLSEEAQRQALAQLVKAISHLEVSQHWGQGKTSSSDGQRFRLNRDVLQRTYSHKLQDYALEFYSFIADNYAPFYSTVIECTDRDAAYVLDGLLYNETDLALEEHFTDTHGYTEINFAAFAMLGRRFAPRIRGIKKQRLYYIDQDKDYGALKPLVARRDQHIHLDWICEQWDRMGQFYASLEDGHTTASTALKRLVGYNGKNHFYRANRELGRIFKTEHILNYMTDPLERQKIRRGLLKGEQMNALAREVAYGKQGKISQRSIQEQRNTSSCLTLIMAAIIYWQANEINIVVKNIKPEDDLDLSLLKHISPISWDNVILYGEYILNPNLVRI